MKRVFAILALCGALSDVALAQHSPAREQLAGTWILDAVVRVMDDGRVMASPVASVKGVIVFTSDGHLSQYQSRTDALNHSGDRANATLEEAQNIMASSNMSTGTYSLDDSDSVLAVKLADGTKQRSKPAPPLYRTIFKLTSDELVFDNPRTRNGVTVRTTWKRAGPLRK